MARRRKRGLAEGISEANITPLADVTTTLIVIFLITMPAILWSGIQVNSAAAGSEQQVVAPAGQADDRLVTIEVDPAGIHLEGRPVTPAELEPRLRNLLAGRADRTVVVVPDDAVELGTVVAVLDAAKASGADRLALLNEIGGDTP